MQKAGNILRWIGATLLFASLIACFARQEGHSYAFWFVALGIDIFLVILHRLRKKLGLNDVDTISQGIQGLWDKPIDYAIFVVILGLCIWRYKTSGYVWSAEDWEWAKKMLPILQVALAAHLFLNRY